MIGDIIVGPEPELTDAVLHEMADIYVEVYAEPPYSAGALWDVDAFLARTQRQRHRDGFQLVTARAKPGEMIGFAFGFTFAADAWWAGSSSQPPAELRAERKFALIELVVRKPWRGRGVGKALHDSILANRSEPYAILTAHAQAPARRMYDHWGWIQIGTEQHTADSPILDSLMLERRARTTAAGATG